MGSILQRITDDPAEFRRLAESGISDIKIAKVIGCSPTTVGHLRDVLGLPRSKQAAGGGPGRAPAFDSRFFQRIDTPDKAYILGFLIADGHVYKDGRRVELGVKESDAAVLEAITKAMASVALPRVMLNSYDKSRFIRVTLGGRPTVEDLAGLGLRNDKSTTAVWPSVPEDLEGHLARGIWDGDGYIGKYQFELIGTSALLDGIVDAAKRHTGCELRRRMGGKDNRYHYAYGTRRDTAILHWMYSGAGIALERKREKFLTYWSEIPRAESLNLRIGPRVYTRKSQVRSAADCPSSP